MANLQAACHGKVAVITGASRGIGVAFAERFAAEGAKIALLARSLNADDSKLAGSLQETQQRIEAQGGEARCYTVNLTDPDFDYDALAKQIADDFGRIDILINNAAVNLYHTLPDTSNKRMDLITEGNFLAPLKLTRAVTPYMLEQKAGWVVNISSAASRVPNIVGDNSTAAPSGLLYGATKAALDRVTFALAQEYYPQNIAFNALAPQAGVATPAQQQYYPDIDPLFVEPLDTMAEAAYLLCHKPPKSCTGKITRSLRLIHELQEPVYAIDGKTLLKDWQASELSDARITDPHTATQ